MKYEKPEMFLVELDEEDIITNSDTLVDTEKPGGGDGNLPFVPGITPQQ